MVGAHASIQYRYAVLGCCFCGRSPKKQHLGKYVVGKEVGRGVHVALALLPYDKDNIRCCIMLLCHVRVRGIASQDLSAAF